MKAWMFVCFVAVVLVSVVALPAYGQSQFVQTLRGTAQDYGHSVIEASDGRLVVTGYTNSYGAVDYDLLLAKFDGSGDTIWTRTLGGSDWDVGESVVEVSDGGLVVTGWTRSYGVSGSDLLLAKFDGSGDTIWTRTLGGASGEEGWSVIEVSDGGLVVTGHTKSHGAGDYDLLLAKFDGSGDTIWTRTLGGVDFDIGGAVVEVSDSGLVVTGTTESYSAGFGDLLLAKFDGSGNHLWTRTLGGTKDDEGCAVVEVADGGLVVTGRTENYGASDYDLLLAKFDGSGDIVWTRTLGGTYLDDVQSVIEVSDGGLVVTGWTNSYGAGGDLILAKFDGSGNHLWTRTLGGTGYDRGEFVAEVSDWGLVVTGYTNSYGASDYDLLLAKFDSLGNTCLGKFVTPTVQSVSPAITPRSPTVKTWSPTITSPSPTVTPLTPTVTVVCYGELVGYWSFDEGSGDTAYDYSGNGNHGTIYGASWATGAYGSALVLDGQDDYVSIPDVDLLDIGTSDLSISVWALTHTLQACQDAALVCKRNGATASAPGYTLQLRSVSNEIPVRTTIGDGTATKITTDGSKHIADSTWHHVAAVFDRDGLCQIYIDGKVDGSADISSQQGSIANALSLFIGAHYNQGVGACCYFTGKIDEVRIYNRILSETEIESLYYQYAPRLILPTSPTQNELNVPVSANISVTFNEDMDETTINDSTFVVNSRSTGLHKGTITYNSQTRTATLDPTEDFDVGEVVTVILTRGIQSSQGVPLDGSYVWSFTTVVNDGPGTFVLDSSYYVSYRPHTVFAADLDGDTDIDLAVTDLENDSVTVLLNNGFGIFERDSAYAVGDYPVKVIASDLDGDSDLDLVVTNECVPPKPYGGNVSILFNNGDGTFQDTVNYVVNQASGLFAADLDGDGDLDLAVGDMYGDNDSLMIFLNDGQGHLTLGSTYPVVDNPVSIFVADLDGDADLDLAVAFYQSNKLYIFFNNGDGTFQQDTVYSVNQPLLAFPADLDGDTDLDLAIPCFSYNYVTILFNDSTGAFPDTSIYLVGDHPAQLFVADLDGDADLDLAVPNAHDDNVSILFNDGFGHFTVDDSVYSVGDHPNGIFAADFDDDGDLDLAVANQLSGDVSILLNQHLNHAPALSWTGEAGFETDGVSPDKGLSTDLFTYRILYTDADNDPPGFGYPRVELDMDGDSVLSDPGEGSFSMVPTHPDNDYTNGREYYFPTYLPVGSSHQYRFVAQDSNAAEATGEPIFFHPGPEVIDLRYDLYIYASDITFSDDNPAVGEQVTLYARVHNNSFEALENVPVIFYVDEVVLDTLLVSQISAYGYSTVGIDHQFNQMGFYGIRARVLAPAGIEEWNESNNDAVRGLLVGPYAIPGQLVLVGTCTDTVYTNGPVVISGNVQYTEVTVPGPLQGGTVEMSIPGTGRGATGHTNDSGSYYITCSAPPSPGPYTVHVEVTDYTISTEVDYPLVVYSIPTYGPDVAIDVSPSVGYNVLVDQSFSLDAEVRNQGNMTAHDIGVWLTQDGDSLHTYAPPIDSLLPGEHHDLAPDVNTSFGAVGNHYIIGYATTPPGDLNPGNNVERLDFRVWPNAIDLVPTDISFSDHSPYTLQQIHITVRVENQGGIDCNSSTTVLLTANEDTIGTLTCPPIPRFGGVKYVSIDTSFQQDTVYQITAFVDADHQIAEHSEVNNEYSEYLEVHAPAPDFQVDYYDLTVNPDSYQLDISVDVCAYIHNLGEPPSDSVGVIFGVGDDTLGNEVKVNLGTNDSLLVEAPEQFTVTADSQDLWVEVDPQDEHQEEYENNNTATVPLPVDFILAPADWFYPQVVMKGMVTEIAGWVWNSGTFHADTVFIGYYDHSAGDTLIAEDTVLGLEHHGVLVSTGMSFISNEPGLDSILVLIDPDNLWSEYTRTNNQMIFELTVKDSLPDLVMHSEWLNFEPFNPNISDSVRLAGTVYNQGSVIAENVQVLVKVDTTILDTVALGSIPAAVDPYNYASFDSIYWVACPPIHECHIYRVDADFAGFITEVHEDNNWATREICVGPKPNLYVDSSDIRYLLGDWSWIDSLIVRVVVHNNGDSLGQAITTVYYENYAGDTVSIGYDSVAVPPADSIAGADSVDIVWYGAPDSVMVIAKVTDCVPEEITKSDNVASRFFHPGTPFIRGDANADGSVGISDVTHMARVMFDPGYVDYQFYLCKVSFDANDDEAASISDVMHLARVMFDPSYPQYQVHLPPYPNCGIDPTPAGFACESFPPCGWGVKGFVAYVSPVSVKEAEDKVMVGEAEVCDDSVVIPVDLTTVEPIAGFSYTIKYDPSLLSVKGVDTGLDFDFFSPVIDNERGEVIVGNIPSWRMEKMLSAGSHPVAQITFEVKERLEEDLPVELTDVELVSGLASGGCLPCEWVHGLVKAGPGLPTEFALGQNYPNPFNPVTVIKYALPKGCQVKLTIYNILGQRVITLVNEPQAAGYKSIRWDSRSQSGNEVTSGIYFYRLQAGDFVEARKMILLK